MANRIFKNQTALTLRLQLMQDLTSAQNVYIQYKSPSGRTGVFNAVIEDVTNGIIFYDIESADDIDESGWWSLWGHVLFTDATEIDGEPVEIPVYEPGDHYINHPYGKPE